MATNPSFDQLLQEKSRNMKAYTDSVQALSRSGLRRREMTEKIESGRKAFFADNPPFLTVNPVSAQPLKEGEVRTESRSERKKREAMENQYKKALIAQDFSDSLESNTRQLRYQLAFEKINEKENDDLQEMEDAILKGKLEAIKEKEKADLASVEYMKARMKYDPNAANIDPKNSVEAQILDIRYKAQLELAEAYHTRADQCPLGTVEREKLMKKYEEELLKADHLHREQKVAALPEGAQKKRDAATIKRHDRFDFLKKFFRKPTALSKVDSYIIIPASQELGIEEELRLVNVGRATMGGTKPMYTFYDMSDIVENKPSGRQEWLFKEATNCVGMAKPEGAVVTYEASKLQHLLREDYYIPAFCVREGTEVIGSMQKKIDPIQGGVDLFKWQANPDNSLPANTTNDLMREHTVDWLICNFDTKGENFLAQAEGHIIAYDKEAAFNHLLDDEAQTMSYSYKPHSNDTIYNTMFRSFAKGEIDLDLNANLPLIQQMEQMNANSPNAFVRMFKATLDTKYGKEGEKRITAATLLKARLDRLRDEYRAFYTRLVRERIDNISSDPDRNMECIKLRAMLHEGRFEFADEREQRLREEGIANEPEQAAADQAAYTEQKKSDFNNFKLTLRKAIDTMDGSDDIPQIEICEDILYSYRAMSEIVKDEKLDENIKDDLQEQIDSFGNVFEDIRKVFIPQQRKYIEKLFDVTAKKTIRKLENREYDISAKLEALTHKIVKSSNEYDGSEQQRQANLENIARWENLKHEMDNINEINTERIKEALSKMLADNLDFDPELAAEFYKKVEAYNANWYIADETNDSMVQVKLHENTVNGFKHILESNINN